MAEATAGTGASEEGTLPVLRQRSSISNPLGCSSQDHLEVPNVSADMTFPRASSPSRPRSRSRASTTDASQPRQVSTPQPLSLDLPSSASREPSETRYTLHSSYRAAPNEHPPYPIVARNERSRKSINGFLADDNPYSGRDPTTPRSDSGGQLTPLSNTSGSNDGEAKRLLVSESPCNSASCDEREHQNPISGTPGRMEDVDSPLKLESIGPSRPSSDSGDLTSHEDFEMADMDDESESDDDSTEEQYILDLGTFEDHVVAATGVNLSLAARLIPQLLEMFRQERFPVVGIWETSYRKCPGNCHGRDSGTAGGGSLHTHNGQDNHRKRQRREDGDTGEGNNNGHEGDGDDEREIPQTSAAEGSSSLQFACPFKKHNPEKYNGDYQSPDMKKGVYKTCDLGISHDKSFKEHLRRIHGFVQCERCSKSYAHLPQKDRKTALASHQAALPPCCGTPPDVNEGISIVQWYLIEELARKARSTPPQRLNVPKWNEIWKILFPNESLPDNPWHTPKTARLEKHSDLDPDTRDFKKCYSSISNDSRNQFLGPEEKAIHAFTLWWLKRSTEQTCMSREAVQPDLSTDAGYTQNEEQSNQVIDFPNAYSNQGRQEMKGFQSLRLRSQDISTEQAAQGNSSTRQRAATVATSAFQAANHIYGQTPVGPQAIFSRSQQQSDLSASNSMPSSGGSKPAPVDKTLAARQPYPVSLGSQPRVQGQFTIPIHSDSGQPPGWHAQPEQNTAAGHPWHEGPASISMPNLGGSNPLPAYEVPVDQQMSPVPLTSYTQPQPQYTMASYGAASQRPEWYAQQQENTAAGHVLTLVKNSYDNAVQHPHWDPLPGRRPPCLDSGQQQHWSTYGDPNGGEDLYGPD